MASPPALSVAEIQAIAADYLVKAETALWDVLPPAAQTEARVLLADVSQSLSLRVETTALALVAAAVALSLLMLLLAVRVAFSGPRFNTIVIMGLPGAGKTALWFKLRDGTTHGGTVTSMAVNEGKFPLHSELSKNPKARPIHVVDAPGHPRVRALALPFVARARGAVYVVDALDFTLNIRANAEFLYDVLSNAAVQRRQVPVLLACNKMEKVTAHSVEFIRKQLEKELEKLRASRQSMASDGMSKEGSHAPLALKAGSGAFKFADCINPVSFTECSVVGDNLNGVETFIRDLVRP